MKATAKATIVVEYDLEGGSDFGDMMEHLTECLAKLSECAKVIKAGLSIPAGEWELTRW